MSERAGKMSTILFFILVGVLAVYGLCEAIVRLVSRLWIPKEMKPVTLVRCDDVRELTPLTVSLWEEKEEHPVCFWSPEANEEEGERISLSNLNEILLFLTE